MSKLISLSIRDFALPSPRTGSIDAYSGMGRAQLEGIEIHQRVQERRSSADPKYRAEVRLAREIERDGFTFAISGRMDGIFDTDPPKIEEIKTSFNIQELIRHLTNPEKDHPYCLQLRTYGYFYWLENQIAPKLTFHLVSTRNNDSEDLEIDLALPAYEAWMERRMNELVAEAQRAEKRTQRRKAIAAKFPFPFERPRTGQVELIDSIREGMEKKERMLIQAPTGLGKTAGVLYPALQDALSRGQRVIYATPKNSQHLVAEDAIERFQETGSKVKSLTLTAKSKICFKAEPLCNPGYCEFARDYYTKVHEKGLIDILAKKKKLTARTFRKLGEEHEVCPFELQIDAAPEADAVICDYNYVFAPRSALDKSAPVELDQQGKPNLVIDEAHNLPGRAMDYYSPALSSLTLEKMREEIRELPSRFRVEAEELLDDCLSAVKDCRPDNGGKPSTIDPPLEPFLDQDAQLRSFLSRYLDSDVEIQPQDVILRLCFYWSEFTGGLELVSGAEQKEFFTTFQPHPSGGTIRITCCDASKMLEPVYDEYEQVVAFSATLKPFEYYAKLSGLEDQNLRCAEFQSPFAKENRKLILIPQVSTKYSERERNYPKIAEAIRKIAALRPGNYFAFFPSFEFADRVLDFFVPPEGFTIRRQERGMRNDDVEAVLEHLRARSTPTIVFAVQGGVFSEGVDYPGETIIGAFIIGPPLPSFDLEREQMRKYYDGLCDSGFDYAYTYPAMAKAVQAAGRVIRSETDRGLIVLMDNRFMQTSYSKSMPRDWFESHPGELVSQSILKEVAEFWESAQQLKSDSVIEGSVERS